MFNSTMCFTFTSWFWLSSNMVWELGLRMRIKTLLKPFYRSPICSLVTAVYVARYYNLHSDRAIFIFPFLDISQVWGPRNPPRVTQGILDQCQLVKHILCFILKKKLCVKRIFRLEVVTIASLEIYSIF